MQMKVIDRKSSLYDSYFQFLTRFIDHCNQLKIEFAQCVTKDEPSNAVNESDEDGLSPLPVFKEPKCAFKQTLDAGVIKYVMQCNQIQKITDKLKERQTSVKKGTAHNNSRINQPKNNGPVKGGPTEALAVFDHPYKTTISSGPLTAEVKDLSQFSIEFDQWGSLTGFKLQLNKEGTELADPLSAEANVNNRWSWNAASSIRKGFLNKILMIK